MKNPLIRGLYKEIASIKKSRDKDGVTAGMDHFLEQKYLTLIRALEEEFTKYRDYDALYCLAELYEHGNGVQKNSNIAFSFYYRAAQNNQIDAIYRLSRAYETGDPSLNVFQSEQLAQDYLIGAADLEHEEAQSSIFDQLIPAMSDEEHEAFAREAREKNAVQLLSMLEDVSHLGAFYHVAMGLQDQMKICELILDSPNTFIKYLWHDPLLSDEKKEFYRKEVAYCYGLSFRPKSPWSAENLLPVGDKAKLGPYTMSVLQGKVPKPGKEITSSTPVNSIKIRALKLDEEKENYSDVKREEPNPDEEVTSLIPVNNFKFI